MTVQSVGILALANSFGLLQEAVHVKRVGGGGGDRGRGFPNVVGLYESEVAIKGSN